MGTCRLGWVAMVGLGGGCLTDPSPAKSVESVATTSGPTASNGDPSSSSSGSEPTGGSESSTGPTPGTECIGLDETACSEHEACQAIYGAPVDAVDGALCLRPSSFLECEGRGFCFTNTTFSCDPAGGPPHRFSGWCMPQGWVECWPDVIPTERCDEPPLPERGS